MPPMTAERQERARIVCLANSRKRRTRCIAGIDLATGRWVRPVTESIDGGAPDHVRKLRKREPALLDILDIPLAPTGPDFGFECENRLILPGRWYHDGRAQPNDLRPYLSDDSLILHNCEPWVALSHMQTRELPERRTLQLIETAEFRVYASRRKQGNDRVWRGMIVTQRGQQLTANITDPAFTARLNLGHRPDQHCLLTVSLSMPWQPADRLDEKPRCYKLIAGVIELETSRAFLPEELAEVPF